MIKLPEAKETKFVYHGGNGAFDCGYESGWNACLAEVQRLNATAQMNVIERESMKNLKWLFDLSKTCHDLGIPLRLSDSQVEKIAEAFLQLEQRLNSTAQPVSDGCKVPEGWKLVKDDEFRASFERWMIDDMKCVIGSSDPYPAGIEARNWNAWKACRAAILRNIEEAK